MKRIVTGGLVTNREGALAVSIVGVEPDKEASITPVLLDSLLRIKKRTTR